MLYKCPNPTCEETWDVNSEGNLLPGYNPNWGSWQHITASQNCPQCDGEFGEEPKDWRWIDNG